MFWIKLIYDCNAIDGPLLLGFAGLTMLTLSTFVTERFPSTGSEGSRITLAKDMFLSVLAYQNHTYNRTVCSWDDNDAGFLQLQTTQGLWQLLGNANLGQCNWCLILKLFFSEAGTCLVLSAAAQILHQCHLKSILIDCIYGLDMLEQRKTCLFQCFWTWMKIAVKVYAGGPKVIWYGRDLVAM